MADPFQPRFIDLVRNLSATTGTGNFVLGAAVTGFTSFSPAVQAGESFYYSAIGIDKPAEREIGRGTMQADGTISRQPISGVLTSFTAGSKSIALIAAAEWYNLVQAGSGTGAPAGTTTAASRAAMAAIPAPAGGAACILTESGREGLFIFSTANHAAAVTADPRQGVHVAPGSAPTGAAGSWVRQGDRLTPFMFGAATNYQTGNRSTGVPTFGESRTKGATDGVLVDSRAACQAMLDLVAFDESRRFVADFSGGLWGISNRGDGKGLVINQPGYNPRTFIGGEFRGIGSGVDLIYVQQGSYSLFPGHWHIRSGADGGSSFSFAWRLWENGLWVRGSAMARWGVVKLSGFSRYGIDTDPENDPANNNNIGGRFERVYANNCGSAVTRGGNAFSIGFTASTRTGSAGSDLQRTNLTLGAGHEILRPGDVVRTAADSYHNIREKVGAVISVYPWIISTAATGTIDSCHGGAMRVHGKDTAGFGADHLSSVTCGAGLVLAGQHASAFGEFIAEGGGIGLVIGVHGGASIGHSIGWMHQEANPLELLALTNSQTTLDIGMVLMGEDENPFAYTDVISANDGVSLATTAGLPWVTIKAGGVLYESSRNASTFGNNTKSRAGLSILSNDPATRRARQVQQVGQPTNVTLKYREPTDRFLRDHFAARLEVAAASGGAPDSAISISLDAADAAAGITINGGAGPYVIAAGAATGAVRLDFWLDTSGAAKNWIVLPRSGVASGAATLTGEAIQLDNPAGTRRASIFETGGQWYLRMGTTGAAAPNGTVNIQGQGVGQDLTSLNIYASDLIVNQAGDYWLYRGTGGITYHKGAISTDGAVTAVGNVTGANLSGTNSGDQTITLTGDVTGTGTGSFAATIGTGAVTLAKQANMGTASLVYRKSAGAGPPEVQTLATLKTDLGLTGTNSGDQTSIVGITGTLAQFNGALTDALFATGGGTATGANTGDQTITLTGDVTGSGSGSFAATIGAAKVTYAKIQNVSAPSLLLGRATAGAGVVEEISLANGLAISGAALGLGAITPSSLVTAGALTSSGTAGNGYSTGAGGAVTQATSKSTGVTLNKICGRITMAAGSLAAATSVSFTLTNSSIAATDVVVVNIASGATTNAYVVTVDAVAAGSCRIHLRNLSAAALAEALVLNFAVTKSVIA